MKPLRCAAFLLAFFSVVAIAQEQTPRNPLPAGELRLLADTYQLLRASYVKPLSAEAVLQAAIRGMVREIDPEGGHVFMDEEFAELKQRSTAPASIGLNVMSRDNAVVVVSPIDDSPAEKAGMRPKDVLEAVDGTPLRGDIYLAIKLLRGSPGTRVSVAILRPDDASRKELTIERQNVSRAVVKVSMAAPDIAVLKITNLETDTLSKVSSALTSQWKTHPFQGLILDLRRNQGGLFEPAVGLASLFLQPDSVVVTTEGQSHSANATYLATPKSYTRGPDPFAEVPPEVRTLPLVVLVDEGTASGAEIIAAALRDHKRARVVGRKTFGRASLQTLVPLSPDRAVKFTSAYWFPPSHQNLDKVGIQPDRIIATADPQHELNEAVNEIRSMPR